jgi:hypothetical protein
MSTRTAIPGNVSNAHDEAATRRANTEHRVQELLAQPEFREALEAAVHDDEATWDPALQDLMRRVREGEFAMEALVSIYGAEFVEQLKTRLGE